MADFNAPVDFNADIDFNDASTTSVGTTTILTPDQFKQRVTDEILAAVTTVLFRVDIYEGDTLTPWMLNAPLIGGNINSWGSRQTSCQCEADDGEEEKQAA